MKKIRHIGTVISNKRVCGRFMRMALEAPAPAKKVRPGQFIHIRTAESLEPFFRRPFSVFRAQGLLEILVDVVGPGTTLLAQKKKGEPLDILGPLGQGFQLPEKRVRQVVMVAGGVGIAPFLILSDALKKSKVTQVLLYGARTKEQVLSLKEFRDNGCKVFVATEDGSVGQKGRVSVLYPRFHPDPETTMIYTCGPRPMMADVQQLAQKHGLQGQASCEEVMACGLGACLGCVIRTVNGYRTVCNDGPVFDLGDLIF